MAAPTVVSTSAAPLSVQLEDKFLAKNIPSLVSQQSAANERYLALRTAHRTRWTGATSGRRVDQPCSCRAAACSLQALRDSTWKALPSLRMPTTRNEEYRFTDISPLLRTELAVSQKFFSIHSHSQLRIPRTVPQSQRR